MTWGELLELLAGAPCLWQDLDGVHVSALPEHAPPTSLLWSWGPGARVVRARVDGEVAFVAVDEVPAGATVAVTPWDARDGRVAGLRCADGTEGAVVLGRWEQWTVPGSREGGSVTFVRPVAGE